MMQFMRECGDQYKLSDFIELDDAYLGGEHSGGKVRRGAEGKTPFVAVVEATGRGQSDRR